MMRQKEGWAVFIVIAVGTGFLVYAAARAIGQIFTLQDSGLNNAPVDASTWIDYHNQQFDFDFSYPPGWQLSTDGLTNQVPFVAVGNPLNGTSTYVIEVFIENNPAVLSSGDYVHQILATDRAEDATTSKTGSALQVTPQYKSEAILQVGQGSYNAYELSDVFEFDHDADQIYVADGTVVLDFDFPTAETNPNINLPAANNATAQGIVNTLSFGE